jgi:hypothetical protein
LTPLAPRALVDQCAKVIAMHSEFDEHIKDLPLHLVQLIQSIPVKRERILSKEELEERMEVQAKIAHLENRILSCS